ncbi:uncharacterized protein CEXT_530321 [Caerostris extrusa]|uniref:Uncharacterized protein n=1 Tax=Caerostris extrusa TaxID=172846 RepID=A0AAV4XSZ6_CAEEX|nr:uncharacterized protein CEXT_530321 [Caerostris extrusa]
MLPFLASQSYLECLHLTEKATSKIDNYDFRIDLVEHIIENFHVTAPRSAKRQKLQSDCLLRLTARHFPDFVPSTSSKKNVSRKCIVCSKKFVVKPAINAMNVMLVYVFNLVLGNITQQISSNICFLILYF